MYNEYIYEKKLNEEKQKQIEIEKQNHFRKMYLKKRDKLSRQYNKKIHTFMIKLLSDMEPIKKSYFARQKKQETISKKGTNIKSILTERIHSYSPSINQNKQEKKKTFYSPLKNIDNQTINFFELPKMTFSKKSDFERIKENIARREGKEFDEKYLKKLNDKYKKYISKQTFSFLKTNQNNNTNDSINKIYTVNKSEKIVLEQNNNKKNEEWNKNQKYALFKNKLLNSKLIIDITNNEKYQNKTFYQGLMHSLLMHKNINNSSQNKIKKIKPFATPSYHINKILNKRTKKDKDKDEKSYTNSINFYQDRLKKFDKLFHKQKEEDKTYSLSEESSDSSINDNGHKEIIKKIITLHYPLLKEKNINKSNELKNNLQYLKKMFIQDKKEVFPDEEYIKIKKNDSEIFNYLMVRKKNEFEKKTKMFFD